MPENFTMETARAAAVSALVVDTILLCGGRYIKVSAPCEAVRGESSKCKKKLLNSLLTFQRLRGPSAGLLRGVQLLLQSLDASLQTPGSQVCTLYSNTLYRYKNVYSNIVHGDVNLMLQYIAFGEQGHFLGVFRIHDILVWIRIRGSMPPNPDPDPDPGSGYCYFCH
jgi:hypothetical protein